ncbi:cytochrome P450 2U1-like [Glandiceps talaboti]
MASVESILLLNSTQLILVFLLTFFTFVWIFRRPSNLPPGPIGLPIIGSLFSLGRKPYKTFLEWSQVYGDVMSVRLGTELVVVLNSREAIKDALVKQAAKFSERPTNSTSAQLFKQKGIITAPSPTWQVLRKYTIRSLHEFGMGKSLSEERVLDEFDFLAKELNNHLNAPIDLCHFFSNAISNVIWRMLFGRRFDYHDINFKKLLKLNNVFVRTFLSSKLLTFIPILWYFPLPVKRSLIKNWRRIRVYLVEKIEERKIMIQNQTDTQCMIDWYLLKSKEIQERKTQDPSLSCLSDPDHLLVTWYLLLIGGTDTSANVLLWAILYLVKHPEIQEKCIRDIRTVIGMDKTPSYADKSKLPYIEAAILEIQRIASIAPIPGPHMTSESVTLHGYSIPKGTMIMLNLWAVHMDKTEWENPESFDPKRFLDDSGSISKTKRNRIMPFSTGSRECPGLELANVEIFLFLTSLLQRFEFKLPEGDNPSTEGTLGIGHMPQPFKVIIRNRGKP